MLQEVRLLHRGLMLLWLRYLAGSAAWDYGVVDSVENLQDTPEAPLTQHGRGLV